VKHTTFVVSASGLPLGCLADQVWVRDASDKKDYKTQPLEAKESYKWIQALSQTHTRTPEADCTQVVTQHEWRALYAVTHKTRTFPKKTPTVAQVVLWIAKLSEFLGRPSDGPPGVTVLWRGWQRLTDISNTFALFGLLMI